MLLEISFLHFHNTQLPHTLTQLAVKSDYYVETCTEHQVGIHVSAGVGGMATVLPVLKPRVQSHYFLDTPIITPVLHRTSPDQPCGPPSFLHNGYWISFAGVERPGLGVDHHRIKRRI
jgi:hypothetical protein